MHDTATRPAYTYDDLPARVIALFSVLWLVQFAAFSFLMALVQPQWSTPGAMFIITAIAPIFGATLVMWIMTMIISCNTNHLVYRPLYTPGLWDAHLQFFGPAAYARFILALVMSVAGTATVAGLTLHAALSTPNPASLIILGFCLPVVVMCITHVVRTASTID